MSQPGVFCASLFECICSGKYKSLAASHRHQFPSLLIGGIYCWRFSEDVLAHYMPFMRRSQLPASPVLTEYRLLSYVYVFIISSNFVFFSCPTLETKGQTIVAFALQGMPSVQSSATKASRSWRSEERRLRLRLWREAARRPRKVSCQTGGSFACRPGESLGISGIRFELHRTTVTLQGYFCGISVEAAYAA